MIAFLKLLFLIEISFIIITPQCILKRRNCTHDFISNQNMCFVYGYNNNPFPNELQYLYKTCPKGEYCEMTIKGIGYCYKKQPLLQEGQSCNVNTECISEICDSNKKKCTFIKDDNECNFDRNCDYNSYCSLDNSENKKKCIPLKKQGEKCSHDKECIFNHACGNIDESGSWKCEKMFSLDPGMRSNNELLCKSGYTYKYNETYYCAEAKVTNMPCVYGGTNQCKMELNVGNINVTDDKYGQCKCKWNSEASCGVYSNSTEWQTFIKVYNEEIKKIDEKKVHASTTRDTWWNNEKIYKAWVDFDEYFEITGAEDCIKNYYYKTGNGNNLSLKKNIFLYGFMLFSIIIIL